ncbi:MAG: hypothetical protein ACM3O4_04020 [Ignavibacteriales bacterium]
MKKKIGLCLTLILMLVVSGCGKTKLTCTKTENWIHTLDFNQEVVFKKEKIDSVTQTVKITSEEQLDNEYETYKKKEKEYASKEGITFEVSKIEEGLFVSLEIDTEKAAKTDLEEFGFPKDVLNLTVEQVKKKMEDEGYTCK